jgi:hypothetical protein
MDEVSEVKRIEKVVYECPHCGKEIKLPEAQANGFKVNPQGWASAGDRRKRMSAAGRRNIARAMRRAWKRKTPEERSNWVRAAHSHRPTHYNVR